MIRFEDRACTTSNGRVSVVIPCYNRETELPRAVASVQAQTSADRCDIVVVDDGSQDKTAVVARSLGDAIHFVQQDNAGAAVARNSGIWALPNQYVAFLDSDDSWETTKIEQQLAAFENEPSIGFVVPQTRTHFDDGRSSVHIFPALPLNEPIDLLPTLIEANYIATSAIMVQRKWLESVHGFVPELRRVQDYDLWLRLAAHGHGMLLPVTLNNYMADTAISLQKNRQASLAAAMKIRQRARALLRNRPDCRDAWQRGNAIQYALMRDEAYRSGRYFEAGRWGVASLWSQPNGRERWEWGKVVQAWQLGIWQRLGKQVEVRP